MKNALRISAKKPCAEKFESFSKTPMGGFCNSCQKEVIDFTQMSRSEVINYFSTNRTSTCGRFNKSQLHDHTTATINPGPTHYLPKNFRSIGFSLLALCTVSNLQSQEIPLIKPNVQTEISRVQQHDIPTSTIDQQYLVKGTVLDEENLPLPGASIVLKETNEGVSTDFDGKFEFPRALKEGDILVFNYLGYETKEFTITEGESGVIDLTITFESSDIELMGEVVMGGIHTTKRNIFQKFVGLFN